MTAARCVRRFLSVLLLERAGKREAAKDVPAARDDYQKAQALVPDVATALTIARLYEGEGDAEATLKAVEAALPLIREDDGASQAIFRALREKECSAAVPAATSP